MANRIHSKGGFRYEEFTATAVAITPGMLIEETSAGLVQAHSTEGGRGEAMFATEDALQAHTKTDNYAVSALISTIFPYKGSVVNALIADGQDISIGDELISDGAGALKARSDASSGVTVQQTIAIAEEARDLTGSSAVAIISAVRIV